jgi:hypothetical protein
MGNENDVPTVRSELPDFLNSNNGWKLERNSPSGQFAPLLPINIIGSMTLQVSQNKWLKTSRKKHTLNVKWSGYRESNPGIQLGRLLLYH